MKLIVNEHTVEIEKTPVNEKEIDITVCQFEFAEPITPEYVKEAYFTYKDETYKQIIVNDECAIPYEVLQEKGTVEIGVVAYLVQDEEKIKRYNPTPAYFDTWLGSLKEDAENSEPITPSEMEQFEQALNDGLSEVENVDIDAEKVDTTTTITITNRNGEIKAVNLCDGVDGNDGKDGTDGIGISAITKTGTSGLVDTYTITYTNNNTTTYNVINGKDGIDGTDGNDYVLTNADKNEIANIVLSELQTVDEVGF